MTKQTQTSPSPAGDKSGTLEHCPIFYGKNPNRVKQVLLADGRAAYAKSAEQAIKMTAEIAPHFKDALPLVATLLMDITFTTPYRVKDTATQTILCYTTKEWAKRAWWVSAAGDALTQNLVKKLRCEG